MAKILKYIYSLLVKVYVKKFCKKQDIYFEYWVDDEGSIASFGDTYLFSFEEIRYDLDKNITPGLILSYIDNCVAANFTKLNYKSYCMGLRPRDIIEREEALEKEERLERLEESKKYLDDCISECECLLDE